MEPKIPTKLFDITLRQRSGLLADVQSPIVSIGLHHLILDFFFNGLTQTLTLVGILMHLKYFTFTTFWLSSTYGNH